MELGRMKQGEIWLLERPNLDPRPALIITRDVAIPVLRYITVAPISRTVRNIPTEIHLGPADSIRIASAATFDNVATTPKAYLTRRLGAISDERRHEMCAAVRASLDC